MYTFYLERPKVLSKTCSLFQNYLSVSFGPTVTYFRAPAQKVYCGQLKLMMISVKSVFKGKESNMITVK